MGGNVQCPVCTLFLLPGMNLSDHLETHPKEQVIKALVQMSLKTETTDATSSSSSPSSIPTTTPETTKKSAPNKTPFPEPDDSNSHQATEDERISPVSEMSVGSVSDSLPSMVVEPVHTKRTEKESNNKQGLLQTVPRPSNITSLNRQGGYVFENTSSSSNSSNNNFFGPPNPYYHHQHAQQQQQIQQQHQQHNHHHQQQQMQQQQQQQHQQNHHQQSHQHQQQHQHQQNPNHNFPPYHGLPSTSSSSSSHGGSSNNFTGHGPTHPPMRLFSYQPTPKPLQPPPAYGAAISQLRSQNSQNLMSNPIHRPLYPPGNYTLSPPPAASTSTSSASTPSRLPPPLPPPPLNQRYQSTNFDPMEASSFNETDDTTSAAITSPRRTAMTPPTRPPPQLYRSPQSAATNAQFSRQSSSPYSIMSGSPSVLRFAESPVTAHYLERENGDFIVQETPKHVVECVEKEDGEFSVIERVYHMPPSVVQINEDEEDNMSDQGSNSSEDVKLRAAEDDLETWVNQASSSTPSTASSSSSSASASTNQTQEQGHKSQESAQQPLKKSSITVLSDVQLDLSEYLDLVGNIIASGKVAKNRSELIKIEKFDPEEVKEEEAISLECDEDEAGIQLTTECIPPAMESTSNVSNFEISSPAKSLSGVASGTTSVIRLAATSNTKSNSVVLTTDDTEKKIDDPPSNLIPAKVEEHMDNSEIEEEKPTTSLKLELESASNSKSCDMDLEITPSTTTTTKKTEESTSNETPVVATTSPKIDKKPATTSSDSVQQIQKRPLKKGPKKLIIKPKSKNTAASTSQAIAPTPLTIEKPLAMPTTSTDTKPKLTVQEQQNEVVSTPTDDSLPRDGLSSIKIECASSITSDPTLLKPLLADANEKLPPEDDSPPQPSTSSAAAAAHAAAAAAIPERREKQRSKDNSRLGRPKPPADLTAFIDECLKKEVEEEEQEQQQHPMHSIFGMDIRATEQILSNTLTQPSVSTSEFPSSSSLFAKPLTAATATSTTTSENLQIPESMIIDGNNMHESNDHQLQHDHQYQQQQQNNTNFVEYPFSFLYGGDANHQEDENKHNIPAPIYCTEDFNKYSASTSGGNSASCTWYQSQSSENDFEVDGKGSYLDLDSCKRSNSFAAATEGSMPTSDALNIRTDEKMPAKGEISEQESNCGVENSWSQPLYNEFAVRFPNPYQNFMSNQESWSQEHYFRPQDLSSSVETKNFPLRLAAEEPSAPMDALPSTSKRKITKVPRKKNFQCTHCNTHFPLLKEKNAHMIKQHGYKRVNRRLIRDPPTSTVTTATLNSSEVPNDGSGGAPLLLGLDGIVPVGTDEDSKAAIVKIEQDNQEPNKNKNNSNLDISSDKVTSSSSSTAAAAAAATSANASRTKYDSMRARDNRMLITFNLSALNVKNEGEVNNYFLESKSSFFCFVCKRDFLTVKLFDEHLVEHPAECFTCHKKFTRWKNFMVHLKRHLGWKDFACTYCEKKFVIRSALVEHMRMHTGQTPLKCKVCGKSFKRYSNLTQHRKRHGTKINRNKEYVCFCGEVLPSKARFIWHKETHDLKPKCCPYCRDRFVHANSLRRHIRLAHSDKFDYTEPMECPMCKQIYAKSSIKAHMATHSMDTQHECLICSKSFSTKWNLKIHNWVHANRTTKPFKCEQCVKAFVREVDYNNHINSHKQIKPYTCEHCGCKFIRKYNYIRHRREHHGNKKFTCDLCGKLFHRHYYLIEHRRIHTGERPFQCTICGKSSTTKTNHNKHLKIHHSRDPFTSEA